MTEVLKTVVEKTIAKNATLISELVSKSVNSEGHGQGHTEGHTEGHSEQHAEHHEGHHIPGESVVVIWIMICLIMSGIGKLLNKKYNIPYYPFIFIISTLQGAYGDSLGQYVQLINGTISMCNPRGALSLFVPVLIYNCAFNMDWHIFKNQKSQILVMSVPATLLQIFINAFALKIFFSVNEYSFTYFTAFATASVLAVIDYNGNQNISQKFDFLVKGEVLMGISFSVLIYTLVINIKNGDGGFFGIIWLFFQEIVVGLLLGGVIGLIGVKTIQIMFNDSNSVVNISLMISWLAYFISDCYLPYYGIQVSNIVTITSLGLFMAVFGRSKIYPETEHCLENNWKYFVFMAESLLFQLCGLNSGINIYNKFTVSEFFQASIYFNVIFLYVFVYLVRFLSLYLFYPFLMKSGYGMNLKELIIYSFSQVRGATTLSFGFLLSASALTSFKESQILIFYISGVSILSLIFNQFICKFLIRNFNVNENHVIQNKVFTEFLIQYEEKTQQYLKEFKHNKYLDNLNQQKIEQYIGLQQLQNQIQNQKQCDNTVNPTQELPHFDVEMTEKNGEQSLIHQNSLLNFDNNSKYLVDEYRTRICMFLRGFYNHQYHSNQISGNALVILSHSASWDIDHPHKQLNAWKFIKNSLYKDSTLNYLMEHKDMIIFGTIFKNYVYTHISMAYDVTTSLMEGIDQAIDILKEQQNEKNRAEILTLIGELTQQQQLCQEYHHKNLLVGQDNIIREIQTNKAAMTLLNKQLCYLNDKYSQNIIVDKEYKTIKDILDTKIVNIQRTIPNWKEDSILQLIKSIPMFRFVSEQKQQEIINMSKETHLSKGSYLFRQNEIVQSIFVLIKGSGREVNQNKHSVQRFRRQLLSVQNIFFDQSVHTSFMADEDCTFLSISIQDVIALTNINCELEHYLWKESIMELRFFVPSLNLIKNLKMTDINMLLNIENSKINKIQMGQIFNVSNGFIMLQGHGKICGDRNDQIFNIFQQNKNSHIDQIIQKMQNFDNEPIIESLNIDIQQTLDNDRNMICLSDCIILSFGNYHDAVQVLLPQ